MRILEIEILCRNLGDSEKFYTKTLGLKVIRKERGLLSFLAGSSVLTFKATASGHPVYHFAFNVPNNKVEEALVWAMPRVEVIPLPGNERLADFVNWNARAFYFYDNNGNILEFIARYSLTDAVHTAFNADALRCISEVAIATDDVSQFTGQLSYQHGLQPYPLQPALDNFAALGDDHGLVIVSKTGRHWFPTEKVAEKLYTRVVLLHHEQMLDLSFYGNS